MLHTILVITIQNNGKSEIVLAKITIMPLLNIHLLTPMYHDVLFLYSRYSESEEEDSIMKELSLPLAQSHSFKKSPQKQSGASVSFQDEIDDSDPRLGILPESEEDQIIYERFRLKRNPSPFVIKNVCHSARHRPHSAPLWRKSVSENNVSVLCTPRDAGNLYERSQSMEDRQGGMGCIGYGDAQSILREFVIHRKRLSESSTESSSTLQGSQETVHCRQSVLSREVEEEIRKKSRDCAASEEDLSDNVEHNLDEYLESPDRYTPVAVSGLILDNSSLERNANDFKMFVSQKHDSVSFDENEIFSFTEEQNEDLPVLTKSTTTEQTTAVSDTQSVKHNQKTGMDLSASANKNSRENTLAMHNNSREKLSHDCSSAFPEVSDRSAKRKLRMNFFKTKKGQYYPMDFDAAVMYDTETRKHGNVRKYHSEENLVDKDSSFSHDNGRSRSVYHLNALQDKKEEIIKEQLVPCDLDSGDSHHDQKHSVPQSVNKIALQHKSSDSMPLGNDVPQSPRQNSDANKSAKEKVEKAISSIVAHDSASLSYPQVMTSEIHQDEQASTDHLLNDDDIKQLDDMFDSSMSFASDDVDDEIDDDDDDDSEQLQVVYPAELEAAAFVGNEYQHAELGVHSSFGEKNNFLLSPRVNKEPGVPKSDVVRVEETQSKVSRESSNSLPETTTTSHTESSVSISSAESSSFPSVIHKQTKNLCISLEHQQEDPASVPSKQDNTNPVSTDSAPLYSVISSSASESQADSSDHTPKPPAVNVNHTPELPAVKNPASITFAVSDTAHMSSTKLQDVPETGRILKDHSAKDSKIYGGYSANQNPVSEYSVISSEEQDEEAAVSAQTRIQDGMFCL